jgi:hypothetical protein
MTHILLTRHGHLSKANVITQTVMEALGRFPLPFRPQMLQKCVQQNQILYDLAFLI